MTDGIPQSLYKAPPTGDPTIDAENEIGFATIKNGQQVRTFYQGDFVTRAELLKSGTTDLPRGVNMFIRTKGVLVPAQQSDCIIKGTGLEKNPELGLSR